MGVGEADGGEALAGGGGGGLAAGMARTDYGYVVLFGVGHTSSLQGPCRSDSRAYSTMKWIRNLRVGSTVAAGGGAKEVEAMAPHAARARAASRGELSRCIAGKKPAVERIPKRVKA